MEQVKHRTREAASPMKNGDDRTDPIIPHIIEKVAADGQPRHDCRQDASREPAPRQRPGCGDVDSPEQAQNPHRRKCERSMQSQPPWFERIGLGPELTLFDEKVVKEEPRATGKHHTDNHDCNDHFRS